MKLSWLERLNYTFWGVAGFVLIINGKVTDYPAIFAASGAFCIWVAILLCNAAKK